MVFPPLSPFEYHDLAGWWEAYYRSDKGCDAYKKKNSFTAANFGKFPTKDIANCTRQTQNDVFRELETVR